MNRNLKRLKQLEKHVNKSTVKREAPEWMKKDAENDPVMAELVYCYENPSGKKLEDYLK